LDKLTMRIEAGTLALIQEVEKMLLNLEEN